MTKHANLLMEAAAVITAHEAERRVLVLENPGLKGVSAITETLYAGWQLLMPGEVAPAHRHSPSALRFILEGDGEAYTSVNGEKAYMSPGDMILTPSGKWHDHGHEGKDPVVWLDVLDLPLIRNLGPIFLDLYPEDQFPEGHSSGTNRSLFGLGLKPALVADQSVNSPMFYYPYKEMRPALIEVADQIDIDPCVGVRLEYVNPTNGGPALSTISTYLQRIPGGFVGVPYRTTEGSVYCVVEGCGKVKIEQAGSTFEYEWKPRDTFVVPCWATQHWSVDSDDGAVVFCATDRGLQEKFGIWREERLPA